METRTEPLTKRERTDLQGYVAWTTVAARTLLFVVALVAVGMVIGQDVSRDVSRGFPWREFEIRESAHSRRFLELKHSGEPLRPFVAKPPLSPDQFKQLGLFLVGRWQRLEVPFDDLRHVA